jgi:hypothetical protein
MKLGQEKLEQSLDIIYLLKTLRNLRYLNKNMQEKDELDFIEEATLELSDDS